MTGKPFFILAGNATQAGQWCRAHDIPLSSVRYVSDSDHLRGLTDPEYIVVGTFWERPDAKQIWTTLQSCMMVLEPLIPTKWVANTAPAAVVATNQLHGSNSTPIPIVPTPKAPADDDDDSDRRLPKKREPVKKQFKKIKA